MAHNERRHDRSSFFGSGKAGHARVADFRAALGERSAAAFLDVSMETLRAWREQGGGPTYFEHGVGTPAAAVRYLRADLEAWVRDQPWSPARPSNRHTDTEAAESRASQGRT